MMTQGLVYVSQCTQQHLYPLLWHCIYTRPRMIGFDVSLFSRSLFLSHLRQVMSDTACCQLSPRRNTKLLTLPLIVTYS